MSLLQIAILAVVQGLAELLPVSSSAHVVVAEKLMGLDPSSPPMTLLLVMLHTGTMLAVIVYFFDRWRSTYFENSAAFMRFLRGVVTATALTGLIGECIIKLIERSPQADGGGSGDVEELFGRLELIAPALALAGVLILIADIHAKRKPDSGREGDLNIKQAAVIGAVQGLSLPFRGFSRSGSTISAGMIAGAAKSRAETFSFALAVILTPAVVARETLRMARDVPSTAGQSLAAAALPSLFGAVFSFLAGLVALKWLSEWLERGRWYLFGIYCLAAAVAVAALHHLGY